MQIEANIKDNQKGSSRPQEDIGEYLDELRSFHPNEPIFTILGFFPNKFNKEFYDVKIKNFYYYDGDKKWLKCQMILKAPFINASDRKRKESMLS